MQRSGAEYNHSSFNHFMMYAVARFNAWVSANGFESSEDMAKARAETIEYFVTQYKLMLEEHLDDYTNNFSKYMAVRHDARIG